MSRPLVQLALCILGGTMWATLPTEDIPSMVWRFHYGLAMASFGAMIGVGIAIMMESRRR